MIIKSTGLATGALTGIVTSIMAGGLAGYALKAREISNKDIPDELKKLKKLNWKNFYNNLTLLTSSLMNYYILNPNRIKPAAVVAGIPIGTALEVSHAMSNLDLKYRATGGVFLAAQEGGGESLRMVCETFGVNRYLFLSLMEFLFKWGSNRVIDMFAMKPDISDELLTSPTQLPMGKNPWKIFDEANMEEGIESYHMTFPIVTRHRIYTSMFIETIDVVESVDKGMNKLTITLFFRKYKPTPPYDYLYDIGKSDEQIVYYKEAEAKRKTRMFFADTIDHSISSVMMIIRYLVDWNRSGYNFEQLISFTFANRLDRQAGGTGVNFTDIDFMEGLMGI